MFNNSTPLVMPVTPSGYGYGGGGGMFGGDFAWIIVLALLFNWGDFGGGREDVRAAVDQQTLISKLDNQTYGLADSTYALNNTIVNGFHGVDSAICNLGYNMQSGLNTISHQLSDCCCQTQRAIDGVNYNMATQACEIKQTINDSTRSILDFLVKDKIDTLTAENTALKFKASQAEQNAFFTANQSAQAAVPAYVVQPPVQVTFPTNGCGQFTGFGGCGCGL